MKKVLTIILLAFSFLANAQTQPPIVQGSKLYEFKNGIRPDSAFFLPRKDTGVTDATMRAPGMLQYRPQDSLLYWMKGNKMTPIASGAFDLASYWDSTESKLRFVPIGRLINTTAPLQGGGSLDGDITLSIDAANGTTSSGIITTGSQDIGGIKNFLSRPTRAGFGIYDQGNDPPGSVFNITATGANVLSELTTNTNGRVTWANTRMLTVADIATWDSTTIKSRFIQNQSATPQTATYNITDTATVTKTGKDTFGPYFRLLSGAKGAALQMGDPTASESTLQFWTTGIGTGPGSSSFVERMRVAPTYVSIGTTANFGALTVGNFGSNTGITSIANAGASLSLFSRGTLTSGIGIGSIYMGSNTIGSSTAYTASINAVAAADWVTGTSYPTLLNFYTTPAGSTTMVERMRITETGLVNFIGDTKFSGNGTSSAGRIPIATDGAGNWGWGDGSGNFILNQFAAQQASSKAWVGKLRADTSYVGGIPSGTAYVNYITGAQAVTGSTTWNGGTYGGSTGVIISSGGATFFKRALDAMQGDPNGPSKFTFRRDNSLSGNAAKLVLGNILGHVSFTGYSAKQAGGAAGYTEGASIRAITRQAWDTTKFGTRLEFWTTKNGTLPAGDASTLSSRIGLTIEDNQNVGVGILSADTVYGGRLQIRNDSVGTQPLIYADNYLKQMKWAVMSTGQFKTPYYAGATPGTANNRVLYVDPADSLVKIGTSTGSTAAPTVKIILPNDVYTVEGVEGNIYFNNVIQTDFGLNDLKYDIVCTKGNQFNDRFSYVPVVADSGTYSLTLNVYYKTDIIANKTVNLHVTKRAAGSGTRKVLLVGDSQLASGQVPDTIKSDYGSDAMALSFIGTQVTAGGGANRTEAHSGWKWTDYTTSGRVYYSFTVSGITTPPAYNDAYSNNGSTFYARIINVSGGTGTIQMERLVGTNNPTASGTLTKVTGSGDASISFSAYTTVSGNPFWDGSKINISQYLTNNSLSLSSNDWITVQLGTNDIFSYTDTTSLMNYINNTTLINIDSMINAIQAQVPGVRIALMLPPPGSDQDAFGISYATGQTSWMFNYNIRRYQRAVIDKYDNSTNQSNGIYVIASNAAYDNMHNMATTTTQYNARNTATYAKQSNGVHPANIGYAQIADAYYAVFKWYK